MAFTKWKAGALLRKLLSWPAGQAEGDSQVRSEGAPTPQAGGAKPIAEPSTTDPRATFKLNPAAEKVLLDAGMPAEGSSIYGGPARAADTPEGAARKFILWSRAVGVTGTFTTRTISALYAECAEADHREPVALDRFLRALKKARGVRVASAATDPRQHTWTIDIAEPKRVPKPPSAPAKAGVVKVAPSPRLSPQLASVLQRYAAEIDHNSPQLLRADAHAARRQGRARKQRGSRNVRWAA